MVYRYQLTYDEIIDILKLKHIPATTIGYTLPPDMYEIIDIKFVSKYLLPKEVKVIVTVDHVRLRTSLSTKKNN